MGTARTPLPDVLAGEPRPAGVRGYELVDGRRLTLPELAPEQRRIQSHIVRLLAEHVIARKLSGCVVVEAAFVLGLQREPERTRIADIAYVPRPALEGHVEPDVALRCVPELIVEVAATRAGKPAAGQRLIDFIEAGVAVVWAIDPDEGSVAAYHRGAGVRSLCTHDAIGAEPVLPRLRLCVGDLFPRALTPARAERRQRTPKQ